MPFEAAWHAQSIHHGIQRRYIDIKNDSASQQNCRDEMHQRHTSHSFIMCVTRQKAMHFTPALPVGREAGGHCGHPARKPAAESKTQQKFRCFPNRHFPKILYFAPPPCIHGTTKNGRQQVKISGEKILKEGDSSPPMQTLKTLNTKKLDEQYQI